MAEGHDVALLLRPTSSLARWGRGTGLAALGRCGTDAEIINFVTETEPDVVFHTACSYGRCGESQLQLLDANLRFGMVLLDALVRGKNRRCIFLNTGTALDPQVSAYALSKHQFSAWGRHIAEQPGSLLQFVNVRLQHMYGPGDDRSKFTTHVLRVCQENQPQLDLTAGEQARDFIFIDDVVEAYITLLSARESLQKTENIDIGSGEAPSIRSFVELVRRLTGSTTSLRFGALPYRHNEVMHCQADISRLKQFGWQPIFSLEAGLAKTIQMEFGS